MREFLPSRVGEVILSALLTLPVCSLAADPKARVAELATHASLIETGAASATTAAERAWIAEIERAATRARARVGVAAVHLETGRAIQFDERETFPMASTYKIAIAAYALHLVDAGELSLHRLLSVEFRQLSPPEVIATRFPHPGVSLSLHNLLEVMLTQSDNTATDVVIESVGGALSITAWLHQQGLRDMRVDRTTAQLYQQYFAIPPDTPGVNVAAQLEHFIAQRGSAALDMETVNREYERDPQDQATPLAITTLLSKIWRRQLLSEHSATVLLQIMERCATGAARLKGRLPPGTVVAHKTGTAGGTVNDAGVITLPDGRGHVAIAVMSKGGTASMAEREAAIADIARATYDYFLFAR